LWKPNNGSKAPIQYSILIYSSNSNSSATSATTTVSASGTSSTFSFFFFSFFSTTFSSFSGSRPGKASSTSFFVTPHLSFIYF
jgi:hypothetical protein